MLSGTVDGLRARHDSDRAEAGPVEAEPLYPSDFSQAGLTKSGRAIIAESPAKSDWGLPGRLETSHRYAARVAAVEVALFLDR
jgi:hypothetical protein